MSEKPEAALLSEFDRDEWFDAARKVRPDLTREDFDLMWAEFQDAKQQRTAQ